MHLQIVFKGVFLGGPWWPKPQRGHKEGHGLPHDQPNVPAV